MLVMGISCYYHDSAVAVLDETGIQFAIHEERLSRVKHDSRFPVLAIGHALEACGIGILLRSGRVLFGKFDMVMPPAVTIVGEIARDPEEITTAVGVTLVGDARAKKSVIRFLQKVIGQLRGLLPASGV